MFFSAIAYTFQHCPFIVFFQRDRTLRPALVNQPETVGHWPKTYLKSNHNRICNVVKRIRNCPPSACENGSLRQGNRQYKKYVVCVSISACSIAAERGEKESFWQGA